MSSDLIKNQRREKALFKSRLLFAVTLIVILILILVLRLIYLQLWQHKLYSTLSRQNHIVLLPIEPKRGLIFDRNGVLLAENIPTFSLEVMPHHLKDFRANLPELQKIINITPTELEQFRKTWSPKRLQSVPLKLNLTEEEVAKLYLNRYRFPWLTVEATLIRHYPLGATMVSALGYMGRINDSEIKDIDRANYSNSNFIGKIGIEKYYENELHGQVGYKEVEINASGRILRVLREFSPHSGKDLHLTIDSVLQKTAQDALGKECGAVVVIQPKSGEVLVLASNPGYDPNQFVTGISTQDFQKLQNSRDKPMYNRAIRGEFPPGSTIKPFLALQGLDRGIIDAKYTIDDPGWFKLPNASHIYLDWVKEGHGQVDVVTAIIVSCDTFFYNLATKMGLGLIEDVLHRFGFGEKTGIDLLEERSGNVPSAEWKLRKLGVRWYTGDTVVAGIGQGFLLVTPLQLAYGAATIANRGVRVPPHLILGQEASIALPVVLKNPDYWNTVIRGMEGVISSTEPWGSGRNRFGGEAPYSVAAKTGTAQLFHHKQHYMNEEWEKANLPKHLRNHSLFIAFAPVKEPELAIAVIVENNSTLAGNVARKVMDSYFSNDKNKNIQMSQRA